MKRMLMMGAALCSACGGLEDASLGTTSDAARIVEYSLLPPLAECTTVDPDASITLRTGESRLVSAGRLADRTSCKEPIAISILLPALTKAKSATIQPQSSPYHKGSTLVVWGRDRSGSYQPLASFASYDLEPIQLDVASYSELRITVMPPAGAGSGYWDYVLADRGAI